jgi:hypothetical protein
MGAVFALASATTDATTARPEAAAAGMRITFAAAVILIVVAVAIAYWSRALSRRAVPPTREQEDEHALNKFCVTSQSP